VEDGQGYQKTMSYDHKIIDQKYHLKGLINNKICNQLINFYEDHKHMTIPENSYKFNEDSKENIKEEDNCSFLNISKLRNENNFQDIYEIILKYLRIVLTNHEIYVRNTLCSTYTNVFMTHTDNIRIIKYGVDHLIKDHSDVAENIRGSLTINLNDDYEGGEFRFFGGQLKLNLSAGEAMLFPAEPLWIHGTEPVIKGARYSINCFLRQ
jgi:hypothetical protein|tara:strand:+ start:25 stop:651 length:627 start_codon:yes stop_codon:yes gene_type:complete